MKYQDVLSMIHIYSRRDDCPYEIMGFREYSIDADLETDTDQFHIILENPDGVYSGIFNKYDGVSLWVHGWGVMHGRIDEVSYIGDASQNVIEIVGRDDMSILVDCDAMPCTLNNVDPVAHLKKVCLQYGLSTYWDKNGTYIPRVKAYGNIPRVSKVVVSTGESEMAVLNGMLIDSHKRVWQDNSWLCLGDWNTNADPEFYFTRGVSPEKQGIPIERITVRDSGVGLKSEVIIYGTMKDGKEKVMGTAKNPNGSFYDGIPRRSVLSSSNNDKNTKQSANAERKAREAFKNGLTIELQVNPQDMIVNKPVWINKTATVVDDITGLDGTFFIKAVNYSKTVNGGSVCTIKMIPDDSTFDILWKNIGPAHNDKGYPVKKKKISSKNSKEKLPERGPNGRFVKKGTGGK